MINPKKKDAKGFYNRWMARSSKAFLRLYYNAPTEPTETNHSEDVGKNGEKGKKKGRPAANCKPRTEKKKKTKAGSQACGDRGRGPSVSNRSSGHEVDVGGFSG